MKQISDEVFAQVRDALKHGITRMNILGEARPCMPLHEAIAALDTAQPVQVNAMLVEDVNSEIVKRYKVEKTKGGFWPYCVKAGDGTMDLFIGSKKHADHFQQALQSACLDGAFMAFTAAQQAQPEPIGTPEQAARFLAKSLKPEEIGGVKRNERLRELMRWFDRFLDGNANPKWFRDHAYELAYAIATQPVKQAQPERVPLSPAQVTVLLDSYYASDFGPDELIRKVEQLHGIKQGGQHE